MKAIAALLQFFFSFFIKQEKQLVVISVCGDSSDNNLEMAIKGHAGLQYSQQNAPKLLISMGSRQDSLDSPASEWQLWTFCAHCNYSGGSWRGTNCKHIPREATMLNSVLGKGEISAAAMEVALWQLLGLLPDLLEGEAQRRASHPTWKLMQKCKPWGRDKKHGLPVSLWNIFQVSVTPRFFLSQQSSLYFSHYSNVCAGIFRTLYVPSQRNSNGGQWAAPPPSHSLKIVNMAADFSFVVH